MRIEPARIPRAAELAPVPTRKGRQEHEGKLHFRCQRMRRGRAGPIEDSEEIVDFDVVVLASREHRARGGAGGCPVAGGESSTSLVELREAPHGRTESLSYEASNTPNAYRHASCYPTLICCHCEAVRQPRTSITMSQHTGALTNACRYASNPIDRIT